MQVGDLVKYRYGPRPTGKAWLIFKVIGGWAKLNGHRALVLLEDLEVISSASR